MAKIKAKTHKATAKRFKKSGSGKIMHLPQGGGNGHSRNFMNRRQRKAKAGATALAATRQVRTISRMLGN
jgi:ribosomal protein L35